MPRGLDSWGQLVWSGILDIPQRHVKKSFLLKCSLLHISSTIQESLKNMLCLVFQSELLNVTLPPLPPAPFIAAMKASEDNFCL